MGTRSMSNRILPEMVAMLKGWEMCMLRSYKEPDGITWSVGYGHTGHSGPPSVDANTVLKDEAEATDILMRDLTDHYAPQLDKILEVEGVELNTFEWNAFLDILFNRGATRLRKSKAFDWLKRPAEKNYRKEACAAIVFSQVEGFQPLNMAKDRITGEVVTKLGLTLRRIDDAALFQHKP